MMGVFDFWNHWAIQILLPLSLGLQVVLFVLAGIRRHEKSVKFPRIILWLAYLLADSTAIYAVGHLSLSSAPREHQLVAFWAPFLLLHLGGPDNITAYALQDNQLWRRHFLTLAVQVIGVGYVLYKHIARNGNLIVVAAILMSAVGVVKYGERTWALYHSNLGSIRSSLEKERPTRHNHFYPLYDVVGEEELILRRAHSLFHICKRAIVDSWVDVDEDLESKGTDQQPRKIDATIWGLMEMELSLMYDILYTKAAVVHTTLGYLIRVVSSLATMASLLLFQFSVKDGHSTTDVTITYVLLSAALFMETTSLMNAVASTWTFAFLCTTRWSWFRHQALCTARWYRLRRAVASLRRLVWATIGCSCYRSKRWKRTRTLGQYNMLHFCTRPDSILGSVLRLAKMLWNTKHYSGSIEISKLVKERIITHMNLLLNKGKLNALGVLRKKWGREALERVKLFEDLKKSLGVEFQEGIIIWHIATDVFLAKSERAKEEGSSDRVEAIKQISNYMMYLLVECPEMLPGLAQNRLYQLTCKNLVDMWSTPCSSTTSTRDKIWGMFKSLFRLHDSPTSTYRDKDREALADMILEKKNRTFRIDAPRLSYVTKLAMKLLEKENDHTANTEEKETGDSLKLILDVWTDFLIYAGNKCSREAHAKKISSGGELTTILWLMSEHIFQTSFEDQQLPTVKIN